MKQTLHQSPYCGRNDVKNAQWDGSTRGKQGSNGKYSLEIFKHSVQSHQSPSGTSDTSPLMPLVIKSPKAVELNVRYSSPF